MSGVSDRILERKDLDAVLERGPSRGESPSAFLDRCIDILYDRIYRSAPPTSDKGSSLHDNTDPESDLNDLNEGRKKIAWIPASSIINLTGAEIVNAQDARSYTSQELRDRGFGVEDISRGDFNLPTFYNRWIVYSSSKYEWRAKLLGYYVKKIRDSMAAYPEGVNLPEYHIVVGILLGYSDEDLVRYLSENGYVWPEGALYDAYKCLIRSRISELPYTDKVMLDAEFSSWLKRYDEYVRITRAFPEFRGENKDDIPELMGYIGVVMEEKISEWFEGYERNRYKAMPFFDFLDDQKRGLSEIASIYLMGHDVTPDDVTGLDEFSEPVDPGIFTLEVGVRGKRYNLQQMLKKADRIAKDVTYEGHDCYMDGVESGKHLDTIEAADELGLRVARMKRKNADLLEFSSYVQGNEKIAKTLADEASLLRSQALSLETERVYDNSRVVAFELVERRIEARQPDEIPSVLASAGLITRIKKGLGARLSEKEQAELSELEKEKYLLSREKKKVATEVDTAIARLERKIINLKSDITKYNRVIETALDRKLRDLGNKDVLGSERQESHDDTIEKTNVLRASAENELHASERELEKLRKQKTGKAKNPLRITASCPKKVTVREIAGSQEEANRMYAALTADVSKEANVYLLYLRAYHELYMQISSEGASEEESPGRISPEEAQETVFLGQKMHSYWGDPRIYLDSLTARERNATISALRRIDGAYNSIKRASER